MKILIIKLGALGDVIMATPILRQLLKHHSGEQIHLLTSTSHRNLFQAWDKLTVTGIERKGLIRAITALRWIRSQGFTRCYDLQSSDRTGILCAMSGIPERIGNHPRFPYHKHPETRYTGQSHAQQRLNEIISSAGVQPAYDSPWLPRSFDSQQRVADWLGNRDLADKPFVVMHAGSSSRHLDKRWPHYLQLALMLRDAGLQTVWVGGNEDIEINRVLASHTGIDVTGQFSIPEEIELGSHARFAITNDSAPMHILSCAGIPVYGIFGPSNWRRSHAIGQKKNVIALDTDPDKQDSQFTPDNIADIPASMVMTRLADDGLFP